jgi:hypothetical protein
VIALGATGLVATGATADSNDRAAKEKAVITMAVDGKDFIFEGPKSVESGAKLEIVNDTKPKKVGPHTFSLVKKNTLPETKQDGKNCEQFKGICGKVAAAHEVNPETFEIGAPDVDVAKKGWDASFGKEGDTWYTETEGEETSRKVSAEAGTKLYYLCVVHPFMQGKIKVK